LSNAIKFTPDGGQVSVDLSVVTNGNPNRYAQVRTADNSIGIAPEFLPYVFVREAYALRNRFRQADGSSTNKMM